MREPTQEELTALAHQLRARRDELAHRDESPEAEILAAAAEDQDSTARTDALQAHQLALELARLRSREIARIDAALERIEAGEYGYCAKCGEPIGEARLEADPTTPLCVACAER